jgi:hypothetical protein
MGLVMLSVGKRYFCKVGNYVHRHCFWEVKEHNGTHWVARSLDNFEIEVYVDDSGRHVGSRDLGIYEDKINVFLIPLDVSEMLKKYGL